MSVPLIIFPVVMVGIYVANEMIMTNRSRWKLLSTRYREGSSPSLSWRGCIFLESEVKEGNVLYRTSYASKLFSVWARLFPTVSVAVDAKGLHLKRQPWHFMHPPLLIPWTAVADIQTMTAGDFSASKCARMAGQAVHGRVPGPMSVMLQLAIGSITTVTLTNPRMALSIPEGCLEAPQRFFKRPDAQKPKAPHTRPEESGTRPRVGEGVLSSKT